jgi:hypothetical protein
MRATIGIVAVLVFTLLGAGLADNLDLLKQYETGKREFRELMVGDRILVFFHERTLDNEKYSAKVERDQIVYQLDPTTGSLLKTISTWRPDLPETLPAIGVTRELAEAMVEGEVIFSQLYIISPRSEIL